MKLRLAVFVALLAAGALWVVAGASLREAKAAKTQPGLARATLHALAHDLARTLHGRGDRISRVDLAR